MPDNRQNVMPFQQDAGFFARRALKKQKDGRFQEAVVLLHRALEAAPDNAEYLLDLAETYSEMGCPIESNRCLLRLMTEFTGKDVAWFALACNLFAMGNVKGAQCAALEYYQRESWTEYGAQAAAMMTAIREARQLHLPDDRHLLRVYRLNERAAALLNADHPAAALRPLENSLALRDTPDTRALYAYALSEAGHLRDAAREAGRLLRKRRRLSGEARVNALRALVAAGRSGQALGLIRSLESRDLEPYEMRRVLDALFALNAGCAVQELLSRALLMSPFDRALLHAQAAQFYNEGRDEDALTWWRHMLEINPDDPVALAFVSAVTGGRPPERPIPMTPALPPALADEKRAAIAASEDGEALPACRWALLEGDASARAAVERLARMDGIESERLLRQALIEPALSHAVKLAAMDALQRCGTKEPYLIVGRDTFSPSQEGRLPITAGRAQKKCLAAARRMDDMLDQAYLARWRVILSRCQNRWREITGLSVALLARTAAEYGFAPEDTSRTLGCSRRYVEHYMRKLSRLTGDEAKA